MLKSTVTALTLSMLAAAIFAAPAAHADWAIMPHTGAPAEIVPETQMRGGDLPDGLIAMHAGGDIISAWYEEPTTRYAHGILGDAIEAGTLVLRAKDGVEYRLRLPDTEVFEDRYPRLRDLDGDGTVEVITIRSSSRGGAAITIYGLQNSQVVEQASTPFIGTPNRWLNIAGIAPYLGTDTHQIAYVTTPHIGGTLKLIGYRDGVLSVHGDVYGFSNHWIGSREMRLSADVEINGQRMLAVPSANRGTLRIMSFGPSGPREYAAIKMPGRIDKAIGNADGKLSGDLLVGLSNGEVYRVAVPR